MKSNEEMIKNEKKRTYDLSMWMFFDTYCLIVIDDECIIKFLTKIVDFICT